MTLWTLPCFWLNEKAFHMVWQYLGLSGKGLKQEYLDSGHKSKWGLLTKLNANSETASSLLDVIVHYKMMQCVNK